MQRSQYVQAGQVAIEYFLKMLDSDKVRLGTLQRRLQDKCDMNWIPIEMGRTKRYIAHERIQNFFQQTALVLPSVQLSPRSEYAGDHCSSGRRSGKREHQQPDLRVSAFMEFGQTIMLATDHITRSQSGRLSNKCGNCCRSPSQAWFRVGFVEFLVSARFPMPFMCRRQSCK